MGCKGREKKKKGNESVKSSSTKSQKTSISPRDAEGNPVELAVATKTRTGRPMKLVFLDKSTA